jgi:uncharacterized protein YukE
MNEATEKYLQNVLDKGKQKINKQFIPRINRNYHQQTLATFRMDRALKHDLASAKAFHASKGFMFYQFADIYTILGNLVQNLMENAIQNIADLDQLKESIKEIRDTLGMDVSKVKADIEGIKATVNSKEIAILAKFAEDFNKQVEETKRKLEEYAKKMRENDLAS